MKKSLLASATGAFLLAGAPAIAADLSSNEYRAVMEPLAQRTVTGDLGLWGTWANPSGFNDQFLVVIQEVDQQDFIDSRDAGCTVANEFCTDAWGFGGDARLHYAMTDTLALQFEVLGEYLGSMAVNVGDESNDDNDLLYLAGGAHLISRHNPGLPFGVFGGISGVSMISDNDDGVHVFGGVEAAAIGSATTVMGQLGWIQRVDGEDTLENMLFGRVEGRYFVNPRTRLAASFAGGYSFDFDTDPADPEPMFRREDTAYWLQFAASAEQQISDTPISWFVGYQGDYVHADEEVSFQPAGPGSSFNFSGSESVWVHAVKFGLRMTVGDSLQAENDNGARTFTFTNTAMPVGLSGELN